MAVVVGNNAGITGGALPHENSWDVWMNKNWRLIDALMQGLVLDKDLTAPPGSPAMGDLYIVGASPTGAWASQAGKLAFWAVGSDITSAWIFVTPRKGWHYYVSDENLRYLYDGSTWGPTLVSAIATDAIATNAATVSSIANDFIIRTNSADQMKIDSSGRVMFGVSTTTRRVHVKTTAVTSLALEGGTGAGNGAYTVFTGQGLNNYVGNEASVLGSGSGAGLCLYSHTSMPMSFYTGGNPTVTLDNLGNVVLGNTVALATNATDGFSYIPTCAGTPTGTPTSKTGKVPLVMDTTNSRLYAYVGGAWKSALFI